MSAPTNVSDNYLSEEGARMLASRIQSFWRRAGYHGAKAWAEPGGSAGNAYFVVRSNLLHGTPPGGRSTD